MTPRVVNMRSDPNWHVWVARPSIWGNPFKAGKDGTREEVVARYEEWVQSQPHLVARLPELKGKNLGCWCAPKRCHADVLLRLANQ